MIEIVIKPSESIPGIKSAFITFTEYNQELINKIRNFTDRRYNATDKTWEISLYDLELFIGIVKEYPVTIKYNNDTVSNLIDVPAEYNFKTKPFKHQMEGIVYGLNHDTFILADDQGLGKSLQAGNLAAIRKMRGEVEQCLIICGVNSIKYNWLAEIEEHTHEKGFVLGTRYRKNGKPYEGTVKDRIDDLKTHQEFFLITNIETLRNEKFVAQLKKHKKIQMVVLDECHFCKNISSSQGDGLQNIKNFKYKVAMSGTPLVNKPLDLYASLSWLGLEKANFYTFKKYYCSFGGFGGHTMMGYRNLDRLRAQLKDNMLRRLKKDVLDLPEKLEKTEYIEMSPKQWQIYNEMREEVLENIDKIASSNNPLSMLLRLRQATGDTSILSSTINESAKIDRLKEIVYELSSNNRKCIIFSNWTQMTSRIKDALKEYNPAYITGEIKNSDRQDEVNRFQTDPKCQVIIGTIGAMGTGLTLTAADTVIFTDLPWHRAAYDQCSDRAYRIGQKNNVQIIKMIARGTIDESILRLVYKKGEMADLLVDGKVSKLSRADLLDIIG